MTDTVTARVVDVLASHRFDVRTDPGKGNQCSCGWWEWGHEWAVHVATKLREAGVLAEETP